MAITTGQPLTKSDYNNVVDNVNATATIWGKQGNISKDQTYPTASHFNQMVAKLNECISAFSSETKKEGTNSTSKSCSTVKNNQWSSSYSNYGYYTNCYELNTTKCKELNNTYSNYTSRPTTTYSNRSQGDVVYASNLNSIYTDSTNIKNVHCDAHLSASQCSCESNTVGTNYTSSSSCSTVYSCSCYTNCSCDCNYCSCDCDYCPCECNSQCCVSNCYCECNSQCCVSNCSCECNSQCCVSNCSCECNSQCSCECNSQCCVSNCTCECNSECRCECNSQCSCECNSQCCVRDCVWDCGDASCHTDTCGCEWVYD